MTSRLVRKGNRNRGHPLAQEGSNQPKNLLETFSRNLFFRKSEKFYHKFFLLSENWSANQNMVLPEINSFVKNRENVEELGTGPEYDENLNGTRDGSPVDSGMISADDDFVKYETINEESIITYGTDPEEYADEQVRF